ncbi:M15 family metallopeptidase [Georgenia sp. Z1344]|uniref:M15 family metallopeptidase n=1 Tax=Georgenia sp. Z1344 TaxID=3416706 RepID=UPI003CFB628B
MNDHTTPVHARLLRGGAVALLLVGALGVVASLLLSSSPLVGGQPSPFDVDDSAHGVLPDGTTAFDEELPGISRLDPALRAAVQEATEDARGDDVSIVVTSGWRSAQIQTRLLDDAVAEYGSRAEAARWVAGPDTSAHVSGNAVDIGGMAAYLWLADHDRGAAYGLCQTYANEPWHIEYLPEAIDDGCPAQYLDPTHDPRLRP